MRQQRIGAIAFFFGGTAFIALGASVMAIGTGELSRHGTRGEHVLFFAMFWALPALSFPFLLLALRRRRHEYRLLRDGIATTGTVRKLEPTGLIINGEPVYRLSLAYGVGRVEQLGQSKHRIPPGRQRYLPGEGEEARVLYDPERPERCLWVESLNRAVT
jgi:hypothetical protein